MSIDTLQDLKASLIRKTLNGSVFVAPYSADAISKTNLFDATSGDLVALPAGYGDLGYLTTAGAQFARTVNQSDVTSWQSLVPTRSDVTSDITTLQVACQETRLSTIGLYLNVDTGAITPDGTNGVVEIDQARTPTSRFYRALSVAVDAQDIGEIVIARHLPRAQVTSYDQQNFAQGDDPVLWSVTLSGKDDEVLGTSQRWLFGGAGWLALLDEMGFTDES